MNAKVALALLGTCLTGAPAIAGVTLDGTMGPRASLSGNMLVPASMGRQVGGNLFHSFGTFNILGGESLYFTPTGSSGAISNVISRVTGGSGSTINGVLGSTISGANVFLINPSGIVFGPNAQLDVSGSFYASTANYLKLGDGGRFDATAPANTVLSVAAPAAFGFLGPTPASITLNGSQLAVPVGKTLGLIGGDITAGKGALLAAPSGTVQLVSTASVGEATFTPNAFDVSSFTGLGAIAVLSDSMVDVAEPDGRTTGGGAVYIRAGRFVVDNSSIGASTSQGNAGGVNIVVSGDLRMENEALIDTSSSGAGRAGNVALIAGRKAIIDKSLVQTTAFGDGDAGKVQISAATISLVNGAEINANASDAPFIGRGGDITLTAGGTIAVDHSQIYSWAWADGDAGNIQLSAANIDLTSSGIDVSGGIFPFAGRGGRISFTATGPMSISHGYITSSAYGNGGAGDIEMRAKTLSLSDVLVESFASGDGKGRGGNMFISVSDSMSMDFAFLRSDAPWTADAGIIRIRARDLSLTNNSEINSSGYIGRGGDITIKTTGTMSIDASRVTSEAYWQGDAGDIHIDAGDLALTNTARIFSFGGTSGRGRGGDIIITTTGALSLDRSSIQSNATGKGDAGRIQIISNSVNLANLSAISSGSQELTTGHGANISISAAGPVSINGSQVSAETGGEGVAGSILISAQNIALDGGFIIASSSSTGAGGNITVTASNVLAMLNGAEITAKSTSTRENAGVAGSVTVNAGNNLLFDSSLITTSTQNAAGGNISVFAKDLVYLKNSTISSSVQGGAGNGGNIFIDPTFVVLNNSSIIANAFGGNGGNITINAGNLFQSPNSLIDASSRLGISGSVVISSPVVDLAGGLVTLPASYLDTSALLANQCAARMAGNASSLVLAGRGGLAVEPDGWLSGGSITAPAATATAVSPPEHRPFFPLLASSRAFGCAR